MVQRQATAQQATTLAQKADIVAGLALFPALTVMVFLRKKVGYRFLSPTKILGMTVLLWALAGVSVLFPSGSPSPSSGYSGYSGYGGNGGYSGIPVSAPPSPSATSSVAPLIVFAIIMLITGMVERHLRWRDIKNGVAWHTYSRGVSWFAFLPLSDSVVKRFIDPAVCAIVGLILSFVFHWLGYYIIFSAFCLFLFEAWDYEQQLNRMLDTLDSLVDSEVMSDNVAYYSKDHPEQRPLVETAGIPTGIAPDIASQIEKRKKRRPVLEDNLVIDHDQQPQLLL